MNTQVHDTTGASPYELVFGQRARIVIFPTQQSAIVLEEDLADEGIYLGISSEVEQAIIMSTSQQISPTEEDTVKGAEDTQCSKSSTQQIFLTENVVNGAKDTLHADICVTESQTIQSELLEKNDESDGIEEGISRSNGNLSERVREDALSTSLKYKEVKLCFVQFWIFSLILRSESKLTESTFLLPRGWQKDTTNNTAHCHL